MSQPLDRDSKTPLYVQIKQQIRQSLAEQEGNDGKVFTEQELALRFGVSRMTVRQAIKSLVEEGLIYRVRGVGTFLTSPKVSDSPQSWWNHFEHWAMQGKTVSMKILDMKKVEASLDISRRLRVPEGTEILYVARLWCGDDIPIGVSYFYLHPTVGNQISRADLEFQHVHTAVSGRTGIPIIGEQVDIEAALASHTTASRLGIRTGDPVLVRRINQLYGNQEPLVVANIFYRADLYRYSVYVPVGSGPTAAAMSAMGLGTTIVEQVVAGDVSSPSHV